MKNFLNLNQLSMSWNEKQKPQRFRRYAAMLLMLLTLGVGQMWADYYYRGGKNSWGATAMTVHNSGLYEYYSTSAANFNGDQFKISTTTSSYDYNYSYVAKSFNGGSANIGDYGSNNCYIWDSNNGYIIVYYPNTLINTTSNPKITFRTSLYSPTFYIKHPWGGGSWTWQTMSNNSTTKKYTYTGVYSSGSGANVYTSKSDNNYLTPSGTSDVNNNVPAIWTYNAKDNTLSIAPAYTLTVQDDGHGSASGSVSKGIKMSTKYAISASSPSTGYHFNNWTRVSGGTCTFDNASSASTNVTVTGDASATVQANFALNTYTVTYNANDAQYPGTATGSTSSSSHTYGTAKALTSNGFSRTGYIFAGWATSPTGSVAYTNGQSVTNLTSTHGATVTLYAKWTENKSTITLVASPSGKGTFQVGGETVTSTQAGVTTTPSVTAYPISGYRFTGWSISGGASISSTSDNPTTVTGGGAGTAATLTATFEEDLTYYDVTFGVGTSYTSLGSLSAKVTSTSAAITSGDDLLSGTGITFTASPNTGYTVEGWYTDAACTLGKHDAGSTTYTIASLSGAVTVYVKFVEKTWSVAFAAGTGGTVTTPNSTPRTVGQLTGISIAATPSTGYTFNTWTITSGSGSFTSAATTNSNKFKPTAASTITASFNETKSTITVTTATSSQGTLKFGSTSKSWGTTASLGVATTQSITATAAAGFRFVRWDLTGAAASASSLTSATITLKADGSGSTGTATAVFAEDLTSTYYVEGDANGPFSDGWNANANTMMMKRTGYSTSSDVYWELEVPASKTSPGNAQWEFKIYNDASTTSEKWYGWGNGSDHYWLTKANNNLTLSTTGSNTIYLKCYVEGTYTFHVNYSTPASPTLEVSWPVYNQVRISAASPTDAGNVGNYDLSEPVSNVRSVKRSLNANTTYTFKIVYNSDFYGYNSGTFTRSTSTSSNSRTISTSGGDMTLTTDYAGDYTFKFNQSTKALSVDFPEAYKITFGKGAVDGTTGSFSAVDLDNGSSAVTSNSTWVKSGNRVKVTAPDAKTGYRFLGWYDNDAATGVAITTLANCTITVNTDKTVYACYALKQSALTFDYQTSATGYGSSGSISAVSATYGVAMPSLSGSMPTAAEGYAFMGFYDATGGGGTKYYNADGSSAHTWDKDVTTGTTLYAYYKNAEITALTLDAGTVEPEATVGVTPTISPTPTGTTIICWTILHSNDTPLDPQPAMTWSEGKLTFAASSYSGTYKVRAVLRTGNDCGGGTALDTETANFLVAGSHTVTVNYKCGDDVIKTATSVTGRPTDWSDDITAPDIFGYTFVRWDAEDGVTIKNGDSDPVTTTTNATIQIEATYAGKLTAVYTQKSMIYFKNTLGWSDVYVNFYTTSDWDSSDNGSGSQKGAGNKNVTNRNKHMTQIDDTDIWYYDYGAASISPSLYVSFTSASQNNVDEFWASNPGISVVYPANYADAISADKSSENGFKAATPMFVPIAAQDPVLVNVGGGGRANYYNAGYWTKYTPGTGYRLEIYNNGTGAFIKAQDFTSADDLMPMKVTVDLEGGQTYKFQLRRGGESSAGVYYGNSGTMTYTNHGQDTPWDMTNSSFSMCKITTNAAGDYTFNLSYSGDGSTPPHYRLRIAVDYPVASGDYRLVYSDAVQTKPLTSAIVNKVDNGTDIVSFFVRPGSTPVLRIQQATVNPSTGAITWNEYPNSGTPTNQITGTIASTISSSGTEVYNFNLSMNGSGALTVASAEVYDGNFYIRTDAANSKWDNYRTDPDHRMTYSEYSITHGGFTHYYCHWVDKDDVGRKNVKFVIANDYSPNISDTLAREAADGTWANIDKFMEEGGDLKRSANVRFMWDKRNNTISRAYVDGAQGDYSTNFLYMLNVEDGADKIKKEDGTALTDHKITFKDNGNWMYEANIKAQPEAKIKLLSNWGTSNTITQYFRGASDATETLLGGSGSTWYDIRVIYDFKTNRLIAGLIPSGNISDPMAIHADVMFIREHQGDIAQVTFTEDGAITDIETAYGVLQFNKWTLNNKSKADGHAPLSPLLSAYERDLFYVSFPFKVAMEEVFGFGTYGQHWIIEEYDGASRAANGYWAESGPNWKFVFNRKNKFFEPGTGYIIALDLDEMGESADIWANTDQVELYFPSYGTMDNITSSTATYEIPAHLCTIDRSNEPKPGGGTLGDAYDRRVKDSHWNVLGVPTYVNPDAPDFANTAWTTEATKTSVGPNFLYQWNMDDNSVSAVSASGYTYHAMHAYLVQYCGDVTWTSSVSVAPSPIVARERTAPKNVEFKVELMQNEKAVDQTFVKLSDNEAVTTGFEFNYDMSKEFNKNRASIYTLIGTEQVAGNVLPLTDQTTIVPVGVDIKTNGDYTFAIPDGTSGIGVTLIDTETGIRTSLSALSYTVNLTAGTHDGRFLLEIAPIQQTPTGMEEVTGDGLEVTGARKVIIDQKMYIIRDGKMYDARGAMIK